MGVKAYPRHRPADLTAHKGALINPDFGFDRIGIASGSLFVEPSTEAAERSRRLETGLRAAGAGLLILIAALLLTLVVVAADAMRVREISPYPGSIAVRAHYAPPD